MKVLYVEGIANHNDPESCAGTREGSGEALTGEHIGQPLSRDRKIVPGADAVEPAEGNTWERVIRKHSCVPAWSQDPGMCGRFLHGNREISRIGRKRHIGVSGPHREDEES